MRPLKTFLTVIGAVTVLVLAANTVAYAATGGKFVLGHKNKASKVSVLKRTTGGPALKLVTKSSSDAPLVTNGKGKVTNLNADKLDGLDASQLTTTTTVLTNTDTTTNLGSIHYFNFTLAPGTYQIAYSVGLASVTSSTAFQAVCGILDRDAVTMPTSFGWQSANNDGVHLAGAWMSGSGTRTLTGSAGHLALFCTSSVAVKLESEVGLKIDITKINSSATGSVAGRVAPKGARVAGR